MDGLDHYKWSGHAVLMGIQEFPGQKADEILARFGPRAKASRRNYREFVMDGISQGKRKELVGGGLRRSLRLKRSEELQAYDERVLGSGDFVERLRQEKELSNRLPTFMPLKELMEKVAKAFEINPGVLKQRNRSKDLAEARGVLCYFAVREMGHNGAELGRMLNISRSGVSAAARRGEEIVQSNPFLREVL